MVGDDHAFLREFAQTFLSDVQAKFPEVERNLKFFNGRMLRDVAHSFAGSATCLGADELHKVTVELESAALSGQLQAAQAAFENFQAELDRVCVFLNKFLESNQ